MDPSDALHHPLFQSVVLPLLLSLTGIGLLRATSGPARASAAVGLSVLLSTVWMAGWSPQPAGVMQKLPWVFAGAWLAGVILDLTVARRVLQWLALTIVWMIASWWLGTKGLANALAAAVAGAAVIACLLHSPADRADAATMGVIAALGLAALTFVAGSLALFQFSLLLAAAVGGAALWLWPKARVHFGAAAVAVAAISWLALAQASLLLIPVRPASMAMLAVAFAAALAAAPVLRQLTLKARPAGAPLAVAVLAGACVAGALALQRAGAPEGPAANSGGTSDDAYYPK